MKIGMMGGTFDPIHNGHLMIAEYAYRQFALDEVWFIPNGNPPHKDNPGIIRDTVARVEMTRLAIEGIPYFKLNTYESERQEKSYTYKTIRHFKEAYPQHEFYFIVGADSLFQMDTWKHPEFIIGQISILAAYRDDMDTPEEMNRQIQYLNEKYHGDIRLLRTPLLKISSSEIRKHLWDGESEKKQIPEKVMEYIVENQLYKDLIL